MYISPCRALHEKETGNSCRCLEILRDACVDIEMHSSREAETNTKRDLRRLAHIDPEGKCVERVANRIPKVSPQSGPAGTDIGTPTDVSTEENVLFMDQDAGYSLDITAWDDPTRKLQDTNDVSLQDFFARPVKIQSYRWGTGTNFNHDFNPWTDFFENKRVGNRLANYHLVRCKLHLKFVINGNGFQYGRAMCAYHPLFTMDTASTHSALINADLVQTSQLPHIFMDPTTSTGGEMSLPFFWHKNNVNVIQDDLNDMGQVFIRSLNTLRHANDAPDVATVSVFAWATDVEMNVLTSQNPWALAPQSGKETMKRSKKGKKKSPYVKQEGASEIDQANHEGMISGPATAVMKAATALSFIPQIAPFAMATASVAGTIGKVAKALGYSRPNVTKNPEPYRPTPTSQLATTNTPDTAIKLTVDDKQELSIDPRIAGIGPEDPMSILDIASRETYLTSFTWGIGTAADSQLFAARVEPTLFRRSGTDPGYAYHLPACCFAALPFKYWTGTMRFRFQIVSSIFHKGRLRFAYDPHSFSSGNEYNVNHIEVIDIAETKDFTLEIGVGQDRTLLTHHDPGVDSPLLQLATTSALAYSAKGNGVLAVHVLNELTTPSALTAGANDIEINVFVSAGDDFEVFVPDDHHSYFVPKLTPQSGTEAGMVPDSDNTERPSAPEQEVKTILGPGVQNTGTINKVFTGEAIVSFRPLLKRYNLWRRETVDETTVQDYYSLKTRKSNFPLYRGAVAGAVDSAGLKGPYNFCNNTLLHWLTLAHMGWRGSIRYKMITDTGKSTNIRNMAHRIYIERGEINPDSPNSYYKATSPIGDFLDNSAAARTAVVSSSNLCGSKGMLYANSDINPNVEFEVPFYSPYRFVPGKRVNYSTGAIDYCPEWKMDARMWATGNTSIDYHVAAGEDFQVYFWTGLPRVYYENIPPASG